MLRWLRGFVLPASCSAEDRDSNRRYESLFWQLDRSGTGKVDITELQEGLLRLRGLWAVSVGKWALKPEDAEKDMQIIFEEFVNYLQKHEKKMNLTFKSLNKNDVGKIEPPEIIQAFKKLGKEISDLQAKHILQSLDFEETMSMDWNEWKNDFLFTSMADYEEIIRFWKHSTIIDIGENFTVPDEFMEDDKISGQWWRQLVSGGIASAVSRTCTAPLERLKVLMQAQTLTATKINFKTGFKHMWNERGIFSLWKGNCVNVIKIAPETSIKFWSYEKYKQLLASDTNAVGTMDRFVCGSLAGITAQTLVYPLEVLKTRLSINTTGRHTGMFSCALKLLKYEGPRTFYKGYIPNILNIIMYAGIDLAMFEMLKNFWLQHYSNDSLNPGILVLLTCATLSTTCGQLASYPLALVRTRMQAQETLRGIPPMQMVNLIKKIVVTEGIMGFYRGITPNVLKVLPAVYISYTVYEKTKRNLRVVEK